jgi:hypothetical protein
VIFLCCFHKIIILIILLHFFFYLFFIFLFVLQHKAFALPSLLLQCILVKQVEQAQSLMDDQNFAYIDLQLVVQRNDLQLCFEAIIRIPNHILLIYQETNNVYIYRALHFQHENCREDCKCWRYN